jgi:hypothetical protein
MSRGTTWRDLLIFFGLRGAETRSALRYRRDVRHPLLIDITFDRTMAQRTTRHGTVGRFEDRHLRLLSDRAKRHDDNNTEKK